ncbi:hypothetical protein PJ985_05945 [Streptomyces sp. ACA25]|uniref:hypothetical protein n=1 Tax=Streptomyces sp. ACA25 TaxID=3022596 RepID=UPI002307A631|nr:hypothetical protein [Streptomyces sp. ACA25]MDB1087108.1 hypothetical protein [Streptomyces sp. ACA25]
MIVSVVLAVVLALALAAAVAALIVSERRAAAPERRRPVVTSAVTGPEALKTVDAGLRALAAECVRTGRDLPDIYAVTCSETHLTLRLATPDTEAPRPWMADEQGEEWSLAKVDMRPGTVLDEASPYPLTVTAGLGGGDRILIDLARAGAPIAVTGGTADVRKLTAAFVTELLTGPVGREAEVTLVGSAASTEVRNAIGVRSPRLHTAATLREAVARGSDDAMVASGDESPGTQVFQMIQGRAAADGSPGVPGLFVVDAEQYHEEKASPGLPAPGRGPAGALLVIGDLTDAAWRFDVRSDGSLDTGALGLAVEAHAARPPARH